MNRILSSKLSIVKHFQVLVKKDHLLVKFRKSNVKRSCLEQCQVFNTDRHADFNLGPLENFGQQEITSDEEELNLSSHPNREKSVTQRKTTCIVLVDLGRSLVIQVSLVIIICHQPFHINLSYWFMVKRARQVQWISSAESKWILLI